MHVWHLTDDTPRRPRRVSPGDAVLLEIGTWPIEPGQAVWVELERVAPDGTATHARVDAEWIENRGANSYWRAELPPFAAGETVHYRVRAHALAGGAEAPRAAFRVGPKLWLALLWHQHQPLYRDPVHVAPRGRILRPAVRLHALRDYYAMAAMIARYPGIHVTINLTPSLLEQIEDYTARDITDRALELTRIPAEHLSSDERAEVVRTFFVGDERNQIRPHPRYAELLDRARAGGPFGTQELRDLQMWASLAWFAKEFRDADVPLETGETVRVHRFVAQGADFTHADVEAMIGEQYKLLRAVLPVHRLLQERGQIEVATSPYFHPILPLLVDTDSATLDRPGTVLPPRFAHPDDAEAQVQLAVDAYVRWFGRAPRGMWPAEGAVSRAVVPIFARHGVRWIASDRGVLARSGRWGYPAADPDVLCQPWRLSEAGTELGIFFRDDRLSDHIGFRYQQFADPAEAARSFVAELRTMYADRLRGDEDRVVTVALDGENAWSNYRDDGRPFLHAMYAALASDPAIGTVTFSEWLDGDPARVLAPHPVAQQPLLHELFTGSWADEAGSAPGVDLGTWIGEPGENDAWALLASVRAHLDARGATPERQPAAFRALYAAEGSDWFWWLGTDHEEGRDRELDDVFRAHLRAVYLALGEPPPASLAAGGPAESAASASPVATTAPDVRRFTAIPDAVLADERVAVSRGPTAATVLA